MTNIDISEEAVDQDVRFLKEFKLLSEANRMAALRTSLTEALSEGTAA